MKNAVIVHGKFDKQAYYHGSIGSPSNTHWKPWLQYELIKRDILAQTPEMPKPYDAKYDEWKEILDLFKPDSQTILVGHSLGGGFLVRWLSESDIKVGRVVLVAPSLGLDWDDRSFFDFKINPELAARTDGLTIIVAKTDRGAIQDAARKIEAAADNVKVVWLETGGHFTYKDMGTVEFPRLLEEVLA